MSAGHAQNVFSPILYDTKIERSRRSQHDDSIQCLNGLSELPQSTGGICERAGFIRNGLVNGLTC